MPKSLVTHSLALLAFTGTTLVRCPAEITLCTNLPPTFPYDHLLSTNAPMVLSTTNQPPPSLELPPLTLGGPKLSAPLMPPPVITPSPVRPPGIYLSSPYAMQVKVPDNIDPAMPHFPSGNLTFKTPTITPDEQLKKQ